MTGTGSEREGLHVGIVQPSLSSFCSMQRHGCSRIDRSSDQNGFRKFRRSLMWALTFYPAETAEKGSGIKKRNK